MTDHLSDELLSSALDGQAPSGALAHLNECAACTERMARLGQAAALFGDAAPPPALVREEAIAAALAAAHDTGLLADEAIAAARASPPPATLAAANARREGRRLARSALAWMAAAAVVIVALAAVGNLTRDSRSSDTALGPDADASAEGAASTAGPNPLETRMADDGADTMAGPTDASSSAGAATVETTTSEAVPPTTAATESGDYRGDLGTYDDIRPLTDKIDGDLTASGSSPSTAAGAPPDRVRACAERIASEYPEAGEQVYTATVRWRGTDAVAIVRRLTDPTQGSYRLWITSASSCVTLIGDTF